jgi:hypothetical protein
MKGTWIAVALALSLTRCASGNMILWNPQTGLCDEVPKAAAYALGGALFAATQDVDKWRCEGSRTATQPGPRSRPRRNSAIGSVRLDLTLLSPGRPTHSSTAYTGSATPGLLPLAPALLRKLLHDRVSRLKPSASAS